MLRNASDDRCKDRRVVRDQNVRGSARGALVRQVVQHRHERAQDVSLLARYLCNQVGKALYAQRLVREFYRRERMSARESAIARSFAEGVCIEQPRVPMHAEIPSRKRTGINGSGSSSTDWRRSSATTVRPSEIHHETLRSAAGCSSMTHLPCDTAVPERA